MNPMVPRRQISQVKHGDINRLGNVPDQVVVRPLTIYDGFMGQAQAVQPLFRPGDSTVLDIKGIQDGVVLHQGG